MKGREGQEEGGNLTKVKKKVKGSEWEGRGS